MSNKKIETILILDGDTLEGNCFLNSPLDNFSLMFKQIFSIKLLLISVVSYTNPQIMANTFCPREFRTARTAVI